MTFHLDKYDDMNKFQTSVLDYHIQKSELRDEYKRFDWAGSENYSLTGFEMHLQRKVHNYIINYYLPSGLFVVVSWVSNSQMISNAFKHIYLHILGEFPDSS